MRKIMTIVGTRPELIKLSRVIAEFDKFTNHILVHTGQNYDYELNAIFFEDLNIRKPDYFLAAAKENPLKTIASIIENIHDILIKEKPEALLLYGDTNSTLAVIAAKRHKIPIFHMEAGNRCFDARVPEESNRKIVDHLSDINIVLSEHARNYLLREGIAAQTIFKSGSHLPEVLEFYKTKIMQSQILKKLQLQNGEYFLVSLHREENVDDEYKLKKLLYALIELQTAFNKILIVSTHPRTRKRLLDFKIQSDDLKIRFLPPFGFTDYIFLQMHAYCVISDSGTIMEEASILNLAAVTLRDAHERPEGDDNGVLIMSNFQNLCDAVKVVTERHDIKQRIFPKVSDYENLSVSKKILRIVLSYIDYVNENVWHK